MRRPRLYLHIGHPKTASSHIQAKLHLNAGWLGERGVHVPEDFSSIGFHDFGCLVEMGRITPGNASYVYYCFDEPHVLSRVDLDGYWHCVFDGADGRDVLLSSEILFYAGSASFESIAAECDRRGYEVWLIAYVCRQDRAVVDTYLQMVRNHKFSGSLIDYLHWGSHLQLLEYGRRIGTIREALRPAVTRIGIFDPRFLVGGDIWGDLAVATSDVLAGAPREPSGQVNPGLGLWGARFLLGLNAVEAAGEISPRRADRVRDATLGEPSTFVGGSEAKAFFYTDDVREHLISSFLDENLEFCRSYFEAVPGARKYWGEFPPAVAESPQIRRAPIEDLVAAMLRAGESESAAVCEVEHLTCFDADVRASFGDDKFVAGGRALVEVTVRNASSQTWSVAGPKPVQLGYRWYGGDGCVIGPERMRTRLPRAMAPGESEVLAVPVRCPTEAGNYVLRISLVQELVAWFHDRGSGFVDIPVSVVATAGIAGSR